MFSGWGADPFAELVDKATSELLPAGQEDIALNLEICDKIKSKSVPVKQAMQTIKKRIGHKNPNVTLLALGLTDICIKNSGDYFLNEVGSREFLDNLVSIIRSPNGVNPDVKTKILKLIQSWSQISEARPGFMSYAAEIYQSLKSDGFEFPPKDSKEAFTSSAAFETRTQPEWIDGDVCLRCRTPFTTFNRKHHCRNCGNVFCQQCSSKTMALPWFGVGQEVRVCDGCFARKAPPKAGGSSSATKMPGSPSLNRSKSSAVATTGRGGAGNSHQRSNTLGSKPKRSTKEDEDLALAIQLSLEASDQSSSSSSARPGYMPSSSAPSQPSRSSYVPDSASARKREGTDADDDPDLAAAIAASLQEYVPPQPSAPGVAGESDSGRRTPRLGSDSYSKTISRESAAAGGANSHGTAPSPVGCALPAKMPTLPSVDLPPSDIDAILTFAQTVRQLDRSIAAGQTPRGQQPSQQAQTLFEKSSAVRPRMARSLGEAERRHKALLQMHEKLAEAVRMSDRLLDAQLAGNVWMMSVAEARGAPAALPPQAAADGSFYPQAQQTYSQQRGYVTISPPAVAAPTIYPSVPSISLGQPDAAAPAAVAAYASPALYRQPQQQYSQAADYAAYQSGATSGQQPSALQYEDQSVYFGHPHASSQVGPDVTTPSDVGGPTYAYPAASGYSGADSGTDGIHGYISPTQQQQLLLQQQVDLAAMSPGSQSDTSGANGGWTIPIQARGEAAAQQQFQLQQQEQIERQFAPLAPRLQHQYTQPDHYEHLHPQHHYQQQPYPLSPGYDGGETPSGLSGPAGANGYFAATNVTSPGQTYSKIQDMQLPPWNRSGPEVPLIDL
ncbi:ubiquitin binding protein [Tilletiaria anomala UBC 951]|uniref:Vacuolar protein sorting-associated protein 27 n=1 Tax=Tilletiaria anomala (strain ATCC 24038 / CBS 436.72 / UBC 951) TaxID=1037660 RepID=A0A066VW06_TILAU|nr:ubiquitin binding protein [Tilletiaria anomala UBC 951]KDN42994.1 ubiquitin binding protein [Tilletiaria anomala UBC 951]